MPRRAAAQGACAVIAQVVPATLRTIGDHERAGSRHRQNGHAVVVAAVVDGDANAGGVRHLQKLCRRAEVQRPPAIGDGLAKAQLATGVIHRTDRPVAAVEGAAAVVDGHGADDEADAAGGDGVARIQHRRVVERHIARQHALAAGGVKDELLLPGGGEVGERGLHLRGRDEFLHQRRHAQRLHPGLDRRRQRLDAVILGAVGDMRLAQLARRVGITDGRVINADKIGRQRGGQLQFDHGADKILAAGHVGKGAVERGDADDLDVLLHLRIAAFVLAQTIDIAHLWQRLVGALIRLDNATAERLGGEQRHPRLDGGDRVGGDALDDVAAPLAILDATVEQVRDVARLGRFGEDDVRPAEFGARRHAHRRVDAARVELPQGARLVADGGKQLVVGTGERVAHHQPAAAVAVGQVFGRIKLEILLGQFGVALGHYWLPGCIRWSSGGWSVPRTAPCRLRGRGRRPARNRITPGGQSRR